MTETDELAKRQKPFFLSFQRKPEFNLFEHLQRIWTIETFFLKIIFAFGILNFGHCDLFGIWYLSFGISGLSGLGSYNHYHLNRPVSKLATG